MYRFDQSSQFIIRAIYTYVAIRRSKILPHKVAAPGMENFFNKVDIDIAH